MSESNNEEVKEEVSTRSPAASKLLELEQLLDPNDEVVIDTAWEFLKSLLKQNNPSSVINEALETISNELQNVHIIIKKKSSVETINDRTNRKEKENQVANKEGKQNCKHGDTPRTDDTENADDAIQNDDTNCVDPVDIDGVESFCYVNVSCPLALLRFMPNTTPKMSRILCDNLFKIINPKEQCGYLIGTLSISAQHTAQSASNAIQKQLNLQLAEIGPLPSLLEEYYKIILFPQKIIECTLAVFVATVISNAIQINDDINDFRIWQSLFFLFEAMEQIQNEYGNLECFLLSVKRLQLTDTLTQRVAKYYAANINFEESINVRISILRKVLKRWVNEDLAFYQDEFTKRSMKKNLVLVSRDITNSLMDREYISRCFEQDSDVWHNIIHRIKMQQIDCSYKTYKNNVGYTAFKLTIFSSGIRNNGNRMYIVSQNNKFKSTKIDLKMVDLLSAKEIKIVFGIKSHDLPLDFMQRRVDKLLKGYFRIRPLPKEIQSVTKDYFDYFDEYEDKPYDKNNIVMCTEAPRGINSKQQKPKTDIIMTSEEYFQRIQNAKNSDDDKHKCIPIMSFDKNRNCFIREDLLPVRVTDMLLPVEGFICGHVHNNKIYAYNTNWNNIQRNAKLYNASFNKNECKEWTNTIKQIRIAYEKEGRVLWYDHNNKCGRIVYEQEFKFKREHFKINNDSGIQPGLAVNFHKLQQRSDKSKIQRAINIRTVSNI